MANDLKYTNALIGKSLNRLGEYCEKENYRGWDNFDGLNSWVFKNSPLYRSSFFRLAWIQIFKRSPVNFRRLAFVPKGLNSKGLALFVSGLVARGEYDEAKLLIDCLKEMACSGYSGISWGYNFDWQARSFLTPIGTPNLVSTVFVINSLLDYYDKTKTESCLELAKDGCEFILGNLLLFEDEDTLCFRYMPGNTARVHNVNMLGAALLARVFQLTGDAIFYEKSKKAMSYAIKALNADYSWFYGEADFQRFIDNFHTGFNLVSLLNWMKYTRDYRWEGELTNAYKYFIDTFWLKNGCPKYYHNSLYPIDIHCSAQGIVTCLEMSKYNHKSMPFAMKIAKWAIDNMQDDTGYFYYQKTKWYTNKISYIRWSQAWMFYALSSLLNNIRQ
jgi:hypothetical protein